LEIQNIHNKEPQGAGVEANAKLRIRRVIPQRAHQNRLAFSTRLTVKILVSVPYLEKETKNKLAVFT